MKNIIALIALVFMHIPVFTQTYDKKYQESIEEINEYLAVKEYPDALPILQKLEVEGYSNANLNYKLGLCYLHSVFEKTRAISYLEKASQNTTPDYNVDNTLETKAPIRSYLYLGDACRACNKLKEAEKHYKEYKMLVKNDGAELALADKRIFECQMAQLFLKRPARVQLEKLPPIINEGLGNFNACLSGDGKSLVFNRKMKFYDAIFYSTHNGNEWSEPREITVNVGSDGDFYPTGLSPDGKRMLLISYNQLTGYDIYESTLRDGKWRKVKQLGNSINSAFYDIDAVYGPDGKEIYFSSNRTSGLGGFDLYVASIDESGNPGQAKNLGSTINSEWDEKSPTLTDHGKLLLFSSQRSPNMGGFDYFYARRDSSGRWGEVYNAGYPLSTVDDDLGMRTGMEEKDGVLSKPDEGSSAESDIFSVHLDVLSKFKLIPVKGDVRIADGAETSYKGLNLYFIDETINDTIGTVESPEGGKYKIDLYPGNFRLVMAKDSFANQQQTFAISADDAKPEFDLSSNFRPVTTKPVTLPTLAKTDTLVVADILFDFDSYQISVNVMDNIGKMVDVLKKHAVTRIELIGYTDDLGNKTYNQALSQKRAANVLELMVNKGIAREMLSAGGMGVRNSIAKNKNADGTDCPEGRKYNRRVELRITTADHGLVILKKDLVPTSLKP